MKRLEVEWRDSYQTHGWEQIEKTKTETAEPNYLNCTSVGYLIDDSNDRLTLAMSLGQHANAADFLTIPREAILNMRPLR